MSTVYVLTNEAMPGLVKVGKTSGSLEKRMRDLYKTGVPIPFSCFYAVDVKDADFVERKIHEAFDDMRLNESREFFTIAPEKGSLGAVELPPGERNTLFVCKILTGGCKLSSERQPLGTIPLSVAVY